MDKKLEMMLFRTVKSNGIVSNLNRAGYSYSEIALCFSEMINNGFFDVDEDFNYVISDAGYEHMDELERYLRKKGTITIEPYTKYRIDKLSKYDIFIE